MFTPKFDFKNLSKLIFARLATQGFKISDFLTKFFSKKFKDLEDGQAQRPHLPTVGHQGKMVQMVQPIQPINQHGYC